MTNLLYGADIDRRISWPVGRAERMARRGELPHVLLPDGSIRFRWRDIEPLLKEITHRGDTGYVCAQRPPSPPVSVQPGRPGPPAPPLARTDNVFRP